MRVDEDRVGPTQIGQRRRLRAQLPGELVNGNANGSTVVIAYIASGSPPATVDDALAEILDKLR
jgi:hypothetical protein